MTLSPFPQALGQGVKSWIRSPEHHSSSPHDHSAAVSNANRDSGWGAAFPLAHSGFPEWASLKGTSVYTVYARFREDWRFACVDSSVCINLGSCVGFDCCVACLGTYAFCIREAHVWGITSLSSLWAHVGGGQCEAVYLWGGHIACQACGSTC